MRSMNRKGALSGRSYYSGGNLCLVTEVLTGQAPEFVLSDLRQPGDEQILSARDALRRDLRSQLFNRKWIQGMMQEGRRGGGKMAGNVWHTLGFKINVNGSVSDDVWEEIVNVYVRDSKNLNIRPWFEAESPEAFQELTQTLLESIRKGYWEATDEMKQELVREYSQSVVRHGPASPERNQKLEAFVEEILNSQGNPANEQLLAQFQAAIVPVPSPETAPRDAEPAEANDTQPPAEANTTEAAPPETEVVQGQKMESVTGTTSWEAYWPWALLVGFVLLLAIGMRNRTGGPA